LSGSTSMLTTKRYFELIGMIACLASVVPAPPRPVLS
jgi:hypothetical protein